MSSNNLAELQRQLRAKDARIKELERELSGKDDTIQELRTQLDKYQSISKVKTNQEKKQRHAGIAAPAVDLKDLLAKDLKKHSKTAR